MIKYKLFALFALINIQTFAQEDAKTIFTKATNQLLTDNMELSVNVSVTDNKGRVKDKSFDILIAKFENTEKIKIIMQQPERAKGVTIIFTNITNEIGEIEVFTPANGKIRKMKATSQNMAMVDFDYSPSSYASGDINNLQFKMLEKQVVNGNSCYTIEAINKTDSIAEKSEFLIEENTLNIVQINTFDKDGSKISSTNLSDFQSLDGFKNKIQPMIIIIEDFVGKKLSKVKILKIIPRPDLKRTDFILQKAS